MIKFIKKLFCKCEYELHKKCDKYYDLDQFKCNKCGRIAIRKHIYKYGWDIKL